MSAQQDVIERVTLSDALSNVDVLDELELPDSQPCIAGQHIIQLSQKFYTHLTFILFFRGELVGRISRQLRHQLRGQECVCLRSRQIYRRGDSSVPSECHVRRGYDSIINTFF